EFNGAVKQCHDMLAHATEGLAGRAEADWLNQVGYDTVKLSDLSRQIRRDVLQDISPGRRSATDALRMTDAFRWLERTSTHVWRICHYIAQDRLHNDSVALASAEADASTLRQPVAEGPDGRAKCVPHNPVETARAPEG